MFIGRVAVQPESILVLDIFSCATWIHRGKMIPLCGQYLSPEPEPAESQNRTLRAKKYRMRRKKTEFILRRELG